MRAVVQRVRQARVTVDGVTTGSIGPGLVVFLGVGQGDTEEDLAYMAGKIPELRIFPDEAGHMNRSLREAGGGLLLVSQFTLYGDCRHGRRPSFTEAAAPAQAQAAYEALQRLWRQAGLRVETGRFQAHMEVELVNDGPVTILLDSRRAF
ncbi:MAG: D-tyrosyl-tRNA(Tyr) deacylase [Firmicutes bacterium]|nr:D-tyrosyl-tRNA(Tyr) deacylase [Bacillota bacterium]